MLLRCRVLAADPGAGFASGMNLQFGENSLGMMPGRVLADTELTSNGLIGTSLTQQRGNLRLSSGQPKLFHQLVLLLRPVATIGRSDSGLLLQVSSEGSQFVNRAAKLLDQRTVVVPQSQEGGK